MNGPQATALIADDEPLLREALARALGEAWPELEIVAQARNGREAVELFEDLQPQVAFLDVHMPGMTGVEVARQIRAGGSQIPIIFSSGYADVQAFGEELVEEVVLRKPFRLTDIAARIEAALEPAVVRERATV